MARAAHNVLKKSVFRCIAVLRTVVAATMTVLMAVVIMFAVGEIHRPKGLTLWIVGGSVSVRRSGNLTEPFNPSIVGHNLTFSYIVRAVNPSSSIRIFYTDVRAHLLGRNSSSTMKSFLTMTIFPSMDVEHQSTLETIVEKTTHMELPHVQRFYFETLANGSSIAGGLLNIIGTRIVQNVYTGRNMTGIRAVYYCTPITIGGGEDVEHRCAVDLACREDAPIIVGLE
ncbi:hypothetical protein CFC21_081366 [Triticum aestivum]|uniref:Late embryogenesis abundant protein LEA-2 subgroup domain-containing protein n=2 Tax=Triticum aestivum TaxID=4565 RepID=A0A3B6NIN1_WHEAT|nr:hypothetical protein CFC21_081366 [Triticum aestivum]